MRHLTQIFERLGLTHENGLYITADGKWQGLFSNRVERLIANVIKPNALFCIDKKPFILFFEGIENKQEKLKEIWNFNESPVVIIAEANAVEIYNGYNYISSEETLQQFGAEDQLTDFSYFELVTGKTWERHQADFGYDKRIDFHLLENIKAARNLLLSISEPITKELANSLIGKVIFVRYLIDRKIKIDFEQKGSRHWTNDEFCELLNDKVQVKAFFNYLKEKFNGDLFPISEDEIDLIPERCFSVIIDLLSGNQVGTGQRSLFDLYDFSIIPVEFISNVYELFIGQNEQEEQGAYYTPLFLVDYILAETVENRFRQFPETTTCKVLDPACGSGIFLVETLRKIIEQFQKNNPGFNANPESYKDTLKTLACENIYGVDKDKSAINVAIFSIYLTLLDYQSPSNIETFKFPALLNSNFFTADFFEYKHDFDSVLKRQSFDFILGNPPWKGNAIGKSGQDYLGKRKKSEQGKSFQIGINNGEIAEGFVLRVSDFCNAQTQVAFVVRSTILYNKGYSVKSHFRQYFLQEFFVDRVFELSPVRREIFDESNDPAIAPAVILFYRYANGKNTDSNVIEHFSLKPSKLFSLFKIFSVSRNDFKKVEQAKLKQYDWLWKVLVYGSYLDFNLILRLKERFRSLNELLADKDLFKKGTGIKYSSNPTESTEHLVGKPFIDVYGVEPFQIIEKKVSLFEIEKVGRRRDAELFKGPLLLVRNGLDTHSLKPRAAVIDYDVVYRNSLTGIKQLNSESDLLKTILGLINSDIYPFFAIHTFCSIGIEREQTKEYEKFDIPYFDDDISAFVETVEGLKKKIQKEEEKVIEDNLKIQELKIEIENTLNHLNNHVFKSLEVDAIEESVLHYTLDVIRPVITRDSILKDNNQKPIARIDKSVIEEYVNLFLERFNAAFKRSEKMLTVEVRITKHMIGLFFKLTEFKHRVNPINWSDADDDSIMAFLLSLGVEKITDRLFIQKDVRGFEKDGFYIVKPNEKRLWHKAIGHLDVNEFANAMLSTEINKTLDVR